MGIGAVIMLHGRFWAAWDYFSMPRETYQRGAGAVAAHSKAP